MFSYLGFEQADQLAGEIKNPQQNLPRAIISAVLIGTAIYILVQIVFIAAMDPAQLTQRLPRDLEDHQRHAGNRRPSGPIASRLAGLVGLGWLAIILRIDAFVSPFGTGLIYQTSTSRVSYGLARNRYFPQIFQRTDQPRRALGQPDPRVRGRPASSCCRSRAGRARRPGHRRERAHVHRRAALPDRVPQPGAGRAPAVPAARRASVSPRSAFIIASLLIYWSGFRCIWKLGICIVIGYVIIGVCMAFDPERPRLGRKEVVAAAWLPVYLIGMGIISWHGQYGGQSSTTPLAPTNTDRIPFCGGHAHGRGVGL